MKRLSPILTLCFLVPLLGGASTSFAQPPDDFGGGGPLFDDGPNGHRPPPGGRDGRGGPRGGGPKGRLNGLWHDVERMQDGPNALSKVQAQKIVALVKPWATRVSMSESDAQKLVENVEAVLTDAQKSRLGPPGRGGAGRGRGGGGGGRGGRDDFGPPPPRDGDDGFGPPPPRDGDDGFGPPPPRDGDDFGPPRGRGGNGGRGGERGGPGGGPRGGRNPFPISYNPFYAPTGRSDWKNLPSSTQQLMARRYREIRAVLEGLSHFSKS